MGTLLADLRYALRAFRGTPGLTIAAVLTLALGIGANSAMFSVVNGVLLEPLPYPESDRLVMVTSQFPTLGFDKFWVSPPEYLELQERSRSFEHLGAYRAGAASISTRTDPVRVTSAVATAELFQALGVNARLGRTFTPEEDQPNAERVVLLTHGLWQRAFGGDPGVVGRAIEVDGVQRTVVGVMPPGFDVDDSGIEVWIPLALDRSNRTSNRGSHSFYLIGRLADGVALAQARSELETLLTRWAEDRGVQHSPNPETHRLVMTSLQDEVVGEVRTALLLLFGAVAFVLLIACANVANLLLAKAEGRQKEIAVRAALGAGRGRLLRQFLTESVTLSLAGGVFGVLLGYAGLRVLLAAGPGSIPRIGEITLDAGVLGFTLAISVLTGVVFGMAPVLHITARTMGSALREGGLRTTAGAARQRLRRLLVVSEVALAVVLVVGSGLLLRSLGELQRVDPGFDPDDLLTFQVYLPPARYPDAQSQAAFLRQLEERASAMPGVRAVAAMSGMPPRRDVNANDMAFEGLEQSADGPAHNVDFWQFVTSDYFSAMGIPVREGRVFTPGDDGAATPVAVINETMARVFWPEQSPIGRRLRPGWGDFPWFTIVGVVKDVKQAGLESETGTEVYWHVPQVAQALGFAPRAMNVVLRTSPEPLSLVPQVRREVAALDPGLPLANVQTMMENLGGSLSRPRFLAMLLSFFAALALTLAALGTYGVMAYSVAERNHEIGIRMAVGAEAGAVLRMVLRDGLAVAGLGLAVGLAGALALTRLLSSLLYGIGSTDPLTFVLAPAVLVVAAAAACWVPARRATRVDPVHVLRQE